MPFITRKSLFTLSVLAAVAVVGIFGFIWSGLYNVGADDQHTRPVYALMEMLRERSVEARAGKLQVPDLKDPAKIAQGAGNYDAMCTGCHLTPGAAATELSKGLYPAPPNLTAQTVDAAKAFWTIKHGVKASGMPAWGKSMDDAYIWNMVAFLQELPKLDASQYQALVARSGGHSHGGNESDRHSHAGGSEHEGEVAAEPVADARPASKPHSHAPGTPPHDDAASGAAKPAGSAAKPHAHAPGTPPHAHGPSAKPTPSAPPAEPTESVPDATAPTDDHSEHEHDHNH